MKLLLALLVAFGFAFGAVDPVNAGSRIDNVVIEVDDRGRAVTVVENMGDAPMGYVLTPFEWSVENGEDVYKDTRQFMAVPPSFQLAPGEKKTVRVGFRNPTPSRNERTFRLSIREVPPTTEGEGLAFVFNHMLPVYVAPQGGAQPLSVDYWLVETNGGWALRISNTGNRRAVIQGLRVGDATIPTNSQASILAGTWRQYDLPAGAVRAGQAEFEIVFLDGNRISATARSR